MTAPEDLFLRCNVDGGCRYLSELSKLERLIGCDATAKFYEKMADRCAQQGCWALLLHLGEVARPERRPPSRFPSRAQQPRSKGKVAGGKRRSAEVTPLVRSDVADIVSDDAGNFVERRLLKINTLDPTQPVGYLYDYWRWLSTTTRCQLSNIDTVHLMRAGIVGNLHVVDVESSDPDDFRFELTGYQIPLQLCEKPRDFPSPIYAASVLHDYNTARLTAAPRLQRVRMRLGRVFHHYTRLILPLYDSRLRVSRLLVGVHQEPDNATTVEQRR
jgi:hypothetical protein